MDNSVTAGQRVRSMAQIIDRGPSGRVRVKTVHNPDLGGGAVELSMALADARAEVASLRAVGEPVTVRELYLYESLGRTVGLLEAEVARLRAALEAATDALEAAPKPRQDVRQTRSREAEIYRWRTVYDLWYIGPCLDALKAAADTEAKGE